MKIGKRLFYNSYGKVVYIIGEMYGDCYLPELSEDIYAYNLSNDLMRVVLEYGELTEEINNAGSIWYFSGEVKIYSKLSITVDKETLASDGVDTSNIIIKVADGLYNGICDIFVNDVLVQSVNFLNGVLTIPFNSELAGNYIVKAKNELYGENIIDIEVI